MNKKEINNKIRELKKELKEIYHEAEEKRDEFLKVKGNKIDGMREEIEKLKDQLKSSNKKELKIPEEIEKWFSKYIQGVDWGYKPLKIVYISKKEKYVIIRNSGGTGGQGTSMGVGGYYYSPTIHWIEEVGYGNRYSHNSSKISKENPEVEGRLTKEKKQEMINKIKELEK